MANDIASHTVGLLQQFHETLDRLNDLQLVESDNESAEGAQAAWMIRSYFLQKATVQWEEIFRVMHSEILPFVADLKAIGRSQ